MTGDILQNRTHGETLNSIGIYRFAHPQEVTKYIKKEISILKEVKDKLVPRFDALQSALEVYSRELETNGMFYK